MKLKVLDAIPLEGSISLQDLSAATGAQDSLLGTRAYLQDSRTEITNANVHITPERMGRVLGMRHRNTTEAIRARC